MKPVMFFCLQFYICCFFLSSCKYSKDYQTINVENQFSVEIPSWLEKEELAPDAPFQYANRYRNFYTVGFSAAKDTLQVPVDLYWSNTLQALKKSLKTPLVTDSLSIEVNGMKGVRTEIMGLMDDEKIYFSEVMLEGKSRVYHLSVWVRNEERKLRFKEDINRIIVSVKEL